MTRVLWKKIYLDALDKCVLCQGRAEDCKHLFFQCPFACTIWVTEGITLVDAIYKTTFWDSIRLGGHKSKEEGG